MSQAKLQAAKELLVAREFQAAKAVLETIRDDPVAVEWLEKIAQLMPPAPDTLPQAAERERWEYGDLFAFAETDSRGLPNGKIVTVFNRYTPDGIQQQTFEQMLAPSDDMGSYAHAVPEARVFAKTHLARLGLEGWQLGGIWREGGAEAVYVLKRLIQG
jgi:hypothetical protein